MKWPFVSVDHHERVIAILERELANANGRWVALLEQNSALRVQGANTPEAARTLDRREPDAFVQAINEACVGKPAGIRNMMLKQLMQDRAHGLDDDDILTRIRRGVEVEDGLPA